MSVTASSSRDHFNVQSRVTKGEDIRFRLTNETEKEKETGNRSKYDIHQHTNTGWQSIFWKPTDELVIYESDAILHVPGEGFTWEFTVTADGFSHQIQNGEGHLKVCSPLQPGSYRFVFHGLSSYNDGNLEAILGTQFTVVND